MRRSTFHSSRAASASCKISRILEIGFTVTKNRTAEAKTNGLSSSLKSKSKNLAISAILRPLPVSSRTESACNQAKNMVDYTKYHGRLSSGNVGAMIRKLMVCKNVAMHCVTV